VCRYALKSKEIKKITALNLELTSGSVSMKFDLITASSVFAFVPDFGQSLILLKGLLKSGGKLVQWDWLAASHDGDFGFGFEQLEKAYAKAGFKDVNITQPFSLKKETGEMKVVMCVARKL
jgi:predicted TPR repeat methyltransferase